MTDKYLQLDSRMKRSNGLSNKYGRVVWIPDHPLKICARLISALAIALSAQSAWAAPALQDATPDQSLAQDLIAQDLIAQEIVEGLPPPPTVPGQSMPSEQAIQGQPTQGDRAQTTGSYVVVVNGDSPRLLKEVQRLASTASLQDYQGQRVIQVAAFDDADRAERQVELLASRGIGANIVRLSDASTDPAMAAANLPAAQVAAVPDLPPPDLLPAQPVPREVEFGGQSTLNSFPSPPSLPNTVLPNNNPGNSSPSDSSSAARSSSPTFQLERTSQGGRAYYVVIPGKQGELESISNQVIRLGDSFGIAQLVQQSSSSRGPHVQVGPFVDRDAASRWNHYFRDFGMDARVIRNR